MTRAAVLPMGPDPFLAAEWLRTFERWRHAVDRLYVILCGQEDAGLQSYVADKVAAMDGYVECAPVLDHGVAIRQLMGAVTEDLVMLCEDDAFVRMPEKVGECFERIERGDFDVVGCPRASGTPEVIEVGNTRFGNLVASTGEAGPLLWPCFLFARRADLERVDNYSVWGAQAGESLFGKVFSQEQAMDTFGYASLMLRENGARISVEPNYRADLRQMDGWGKTQWFHVGSLSTGYGKYFCGPRANTGIWAALRDTDLTDWCKRVAFWELVSERGEDLGDTRVAYREGVAELARETGMDRAVISDWRTKFERLMH